MSNLPVFFLLLVGVFFLWAITTTVVRSRRGVQEQQSLNRVYAEEKLERSRRIGIWAMRDTWGESTCLLIDNRRVIPDMTQAMVRASWGEPSEINHQQETPSTESKRECWVYGDPLEGAQYVHFSNGKVIKVTS